jgi:hypothetical protein
MKKLDLLRTARAGFVQLPPPDHVLVNDAAQMRLATHGIVFAGRHAPDGTGFGFDATGAQALRELAALLWRANPSYHLGTEAGRFLCAVVDAVTSDFRARGTTPLQPDQDAVLEASLRSWFASQTFARTFFIPCTILPEHATAFSIGPVAFLSLQDFVAREGLGDGGDAFSSISYGPLLQAMRERSAGWLADITVVGRDKELAVETADLAVDIALVAIQMAIPVHYSRAVARITGRTFPAWTGQVSKGAGQISSGITRQDPGHGFSAQAFDHFMAQQADMLTSIGNRVTAFVTRQCQLPHLEQAWADAAYWFHEGLAEPLDTVATAKLETALEVLFGAGSTKGSTNRLVEAFKAFYGLSKGDDINPKASLTVGKFVGQIVEARSRILHGTFSTLSKTGTVEDAHSLRAAIEWLAMDLLRQFSLLLDRYGQQSAAPGDETGVFLAWIANQRAAAAVP